MSPAVRTLHCLKVSRAPIPPPIDPEAFDHDHINAILEGHLA